MLLDRVVINRVEGFQVISDINGKIFEVKQTDLILSFLFSNNRHCLVLQLPLQPPNTQYSVFAGV